MASYLNISLDILKDEERIELANLITPIISTMTAEVDSHISFITDEMNKSKVKLIEALGRKRKSTITVEMRDEDGVREISLEVIEDAINYFVKKRQAPLREAAELIGGLFAAAFDDVNLNNNTLQTVRIDMFLDSIDNAEAASAIKTLNIGFEIEDLKTSNSNYAEFKAERAAIKESNDTPLLEPSRRELNRDISFLENHIEYRHRKGSDAHGDLAEQIIAPITDIMAVARARATRKGNVAS
jgi:hypothetical protein